MKLSFNEGTTFESASLQQNLEYCEKHGYDFIEIRSIDQLKDYLKEYTLEDLKAYFDTHHIKPLSLNALCFFNIKNDKRIHIITLNAVGNIYDIFTTPKDIMI